MKRPVMIVLVLGLLIALLFAGCVSKATPTREEAWMTPEIEGGQPQLSAEVPDDIPIMPGAYRLQVARSGSQITYQVDGDIPPVVEFYQQQLETLGWQMTRSPDSVVGAIAAMARTNEAGDSLTINMQYNPNGDFVVIAIAILRAENK